MSLCGTDLQKAPILICQCGGSISAGFMASFLAPVESFILRQRLRLEQGAYRFLSGDGSAFNRYAWLIEATGSLAATSRAA